MKGVFNSSDATNVGMSRQQLSMMAKAGKIERLARGVYFAGDIEDLAVTELLVLAKRGADFVVALESALHFHGFANATPHAVNIAMRRGARKPAVEFPVSVIRVSDQAYVHGVMVKKIQDVNLRVTTPAKTVADIFKFRHRIGIDVAIQALKEGLRRRMFSVDELMAAARIDRVERVVRPYVEGYFG